MTWHPTEPRTLRAEDLAEHDAINEDIWSRSAGVQASIQPPRSFWAVGQVGAQQAMCGDRALPWVPDLVGAELDASGSVLVVGMTYAGFIRRAGHGRGLLSPAAYGNCLTAREFCARFVNTVVLRYRYYQHVLDALPAEVGPRRVGFTDLCQACFVKVGATGDSSSSVERADPALFSRYVEHPEQQRWHVQRIKGTGAGVPIALGHVAEHGLLRLLRDCIGCSIKTSGRADVAFTRRSGAASWPNAYAHNDRKIGTWATTADWWEAAGPLGRWNVVTVPHTSENPLEAVHAARIRRAWEDLGGTDA